MIYTCHRVYSYIGRGFLTLDDIMSIFEEVAPSIPKATILSIFRYMNFLFGE